MFSHRKNVECGSGSGYEKLDHSNRGSESEDKRNVFLKAASIVSTSLDWPRTYRVGKMGNRLKKIPVWPEKFRHGRKKDEEGEMQAYLTKLCELK
jgi:hypothetical protein